MQPVGVDRDGGAALEPAEEEDGTAGTHEVERVAPRLFRPRRLDDDVGAAAVTRLGTELARELAGRVCRNDSPAVLGEAAEHVPERSGRIAEQNGMAAPERLQVGAVRQRDLDAHEHVAVAGLRARDVLDAYVTRGVEARRPHGVNTTLSASRRRNSSSPSANLSSGRTIGSGTSSSGRSAAASRIAAGVPEREPASVSSRR